jgi:hypothetical protein
MPIEHVDVQDEGVLHDVTARQLQDKLRGRRFDEPRRHGKWLIVPVGKGSMLLHFGMTGSLHWTDSGQARHRHDRVVFSFANGELRYRDMRKLHGLPWAEDQQKVEEILARVGPDAAEISGDRLPELLTGRRMQIKSALLDQSIRRDRQPARRRNPVAGAHPPPPAVHPPGPRRARGTRNCSAGREALRFYRDQADNSLWKIVKDTTSGEVTTLVLTDSDAWTVTVTTTLTSAAPTRGPDQAVHAETPPGERISFARHPYGCIVGM